MKEAWLESYPINITGYPNKFVPDNCFGETIIILNKKNLNPSVNVKSDKFFWETMLQNVLLLWNSE